MPNWRREKKKFWFETVFSWPELQNSIKNSKKIQKIQKNYPASFQVEMGRDKMKNGKNNFSFGAVFTRTELENSQKK